MQWYYLVQGQRQGPVEDSDLETLVRQGIVRDDTLVWREGLADWQPFGAVKPKPEHAPPPPAPPKPEPASPPKTETAPPGSAHAARHFAPPSAAAISAAVRSHGGFFFYPILEALSDGRVIRKCVIVGLKVVAIIELIGGLLMAISVLTLMSHGSAGAVLGAILFAILLLATTVSTAQICWYRSGTVAELGHSKYTVIPIFSILSRLGGETAATVLIGVGVGACLLLWLSPESPAAVLGAVPIPLFEGFAAQAGFLGGLIVLVYGAVAGFGALIMGYVWAEGIMLLVDIEQNTHKSV